MYSDATLNEVRSATSIVDLISEYVGLKKSGQGYSGLCPFHNEKTPSFHVHPQKQIFHCFGCQRGGNVFTFLSAVEGINFPEAVQRLAKRAGVTLQEEGPRKPKPSGPSANEQRLIEAMEWAAKYFNYLLKEMPDYRYAAEYVKNRGISEKGVDRFRIGVSPKGWSTLLEHMLKRNFRFEELVEAGLVVPRDNSPHKGYDRFRERLMFPIRNLEGTVIGFGARLLKDEPNQPKYLNSPESPLFSKRQHLYGAFENQRGIRLKGEVVIVEGYMDVVGLSEQGVQNAVATMGTALTEEHCARLKPLTNRVVTVFDPDAGGQEAWRRSVSIFLQQGFFAKDLTLPGGQDPDEFIQQSGAEEFYRMCEKAPRQVTKLLKNIASEGALSEEKTAAYLEELTPVLVASRRSPDRAILWDSISLVLRVNVEVLKEISESGHGFLRNQKNDKPESAPKTPTRQVATKPTRPAQHDTLEFGFLRACMEWPELFHALPAKERVDWVKNGEIKKWLQRLGESAAPADVALVFQEMTQTDSDPEIQGAASHVLLSTQKTMEKSLVNELFNRLKQRRKEEEIHTLVAQIKLVEKMGDAQTGMKLLEQLKELRSS